MAIPDALDHYRLEAQEADIAPRAHATMLLCETAMKLAAYGRTMNLSVHCLSRGEFDSFDCDETRHVSDDGDREWWSKNVRLHDGIGRVMLYLYTDEPAVPPAPVQTVDADALSRIEAFAAEASPEQIAFDDNGRPCTAVVAEAIAEGELAQSAWTIDHPSGTRYAMYIARGGDLIARPIQAPVQA